MKAYATTRPPAVAGMFYPGGRAELEVSVRAHLAAATIAGAIPPKAVIAPHAGYIYSGPTAGFAFQALAARAAEIRRVVLLGPSHRVPVRGLALPAALEFETPLGRVPVDAELAAELTDLRQVEVSDAAHALEHSLEVELPFLQVALSEFSILPLVVGHPSPREVAEVLDRAWGGGETAVVVSSDLSHYLRYDRARRIDRETVEQILRLETPIDPERACGAYSIGGLLEAARELRLEAELLDLRNSGDTAGDRNRVVGYAAVAFH